MALPFIIISILAIADLMPYQSPMHWLTYAEAMGDIAAALRQYELANTHRQEAPRLLAQRDPQQMREYVRNSKDLDSKNGDRKDPELLKW